MVYKEKFNIEGESFFFMPFGVNLIPPTPLLLWSVVPVFLGLVPLFILLSFFPFLICFGCDWRSLWKGQRDQGKKLLLETA